MTDKAFVEVRQGAAAVCFGLVLALLGLVVGGHSGNVLASSGLLAICLGLVFVGVGFARRRRSPRGEEVVVGPLVDRTEVDRDAVAEVEGRHRGRPL